MAPQLNGFVAALLANFALASWLAALVWNAPKCFVEVCLLAKLIVTWAKAQVAFPDYHRCCGLTRQEILGAVALSAHLSHLRRTPCCRGRKVHIHGMPRSESEFG